LKIFNKDGQKMCIIVAYLDLWRPWVDSNTGDPTYFRTHKGDRT